MFRLFVRWRLIYMAAVALITIALPHDGVQAQDIGALVTPSPEVTPAAIVTDTPAPTSLATAVVPPEATAAITEPVTEAVTVNLTPETVEATITPVVTEAATVITPASTPVAIDTFPPVASNAAPVSTDTSTDSPPPAAPSVASVTSESSTTIPSEAASNDVGSSMQGSESEESASSSSSSSSSSSASEYVTETVTEFFTTTTIVLFMLGGIGLTIVMSLLYVLWRNQRREDPGLETPVSEDSTTTTFPAVSMPSIIAPTARDLSVWKAGESKFTSQDLPLTANVHAKLNAVSRSSIEYDMASRYSNVAILRVHESLAQDPEASRETNVFSKQSFGISEYSEFSIHDATDLETETPAMTNNRDSASDGYSAGDRYSMYGKYSASSRLSSDPGRRSSSWSQLQVPKNLDMYRYSSTSSTNSSIVVRNHNPASSVNPDQPSSTDTPGTVDNTTSRTDVINWYSVIESPTDIGRYTTLSFSSDTTSIGRESFEL
ncbi:unnamed protein product [Peronospora belbahrii]|uniref:Uncharacterized protein n=1 Tax=Peronospora belbahrii TaxID=622444 RepID=A0AAU9KFR7_9STRA|nr:unnamed protein product [Peronospora belbahrii]CAH0518237.1 unnamed protein product [Peronospora belbahrii]